MIHKIRPTIYIPFEELPEAKDWKIDSTYRVEMKLKQTGMMSDSAMFEIIDVKSLEKKEEMPRFYPAEGGAYLEHKQ